ncbi:TonB-dependent siderophore receptor [Pseudomonas sp. JQ170]|uniref:TonB-dependent siderophore receptor n=1 Tax=unclassified Pseudomonas TaxID=196821 RepID=UPI0026507F4F|nr:MULTISPECIES: TonB-dependent receptor [unclassified Pseudomonas]MDN7143028.1 TonB-dependent siderophore receptor [Pseudomonas sp. JQ170]WRO74477.1 TonB-dependent siderophore receptor [Pseudomonas sp. 170C]
MPSRLPTHLNTLALAIALGLSTTVLPSLPIQASERAQVQAFDIAAGPLSARLNQLASEAGILLAGDSRLTQGKTGQAVRGRYPAAQALQIMLVGTGLSAVASGDNRYLLQAAQDGETLELGVTSIDARTDSATTEGSGSYTSPVTTIGKGVKALKDIPQAVSVVTRQRMDEQNISTVTEALINSPGITVVPSFTGSQFYSRGFFINSFQYDGVPLERQLYARGSSFGGQTAILDRVEVLRGPQGLLEGGGDPSGAVNLVRKRPTHSAQTHLSAKAGSWDHYGAQVDTAGPLDAQGRVRGRLVMDYDTTQSFVDVVQSDNQTLYAALDFDLTDSTQLGVGYSHERLDATPYMMGIPNYSDGSMPSLDRSTFLGARWDNWDKRQDTYYLDLNQQLSDDWKLKASVVNIREFNDFKYLQRRGRMGPGYTLAGDAYVFDYFSEHWGGDINATGDLQLFGRRLGLTLGGNYSRLKSNDVWGARYNYVTPINIFDYSPSAIEPSDDSIYSANQWLDGYTSTQKGLYAVGDYQLTDNLSLILGSRVSSFRTVFDSDGPWGVTRSTAEKNGKVTPYAGLVYSLNEHWNAYASYTEIFKPQTQRTAEGSLLDARTGKSYEIGLKGEHANGRLNTAFALYQMEQDNIPMPDAGIPSDIANAQCGGTCYVPSGTIHSRGFEAEISGEVLPDLQVSAAYTLNLLKYLDEEPATAGNISANTQTPKHILRTWANYRLPGEWQRVSVGAGVNAQSSSAGFGYYGREQGGYAVWNSRVAYAFDEHLSAALNINNLFDRKYYRAIDYDHNFYGDPRNVLMSLDYRF